MGAQKVAGTSGNVLYDYYGFIIGAVCEGPVDALLSIIADGKELWPGAVAWAVGQSIALNNLRRFNGKTWKSISGSTYTSATINDPTHPAFWTEYFIGRGVTDYADITTTRGDIRIYWGTQTQIRDTDIVFLTGANQFSEAHPSYKGICYVVLRSFLLGRERTSAPNIEVVVRRAPNQSIITGTPAALNDGQANPFAIAAELLTSPNAIGLPNSALNAATFQAAAVLADAGASLAAASPLLDQQTSVRAVAADLAALSEMWLRFNPITGLIEAGLFTHSPTEMNATLLADTGEILTTDLGVQIVADLGAPAPNLAIDDLTERPKFSAEGWSQVKTRAVVEFIDRARAYKQTSDKVDDMRAFLVLGEHRPIKLDRPYITRRTQALAHAFETLRISGRPQLSGEITVRREKARTIRPGDYVLLDIDLEPGGATILQYFRVLSRTIPERGPIKFELSAELTLTPASYSALDNLVLETDTTVPCVTVLRVVEAPPAMSHGAESLIALAQRPDTSVGGWDAYWDVSSSGTFQKLLRANSFAARATLRTALNTSAVTIEITASAQADMDLFTEQPGAVAAADDSLFVVLVEMAGGDIKTDGYRTAQVEWCSISAQSLVSGMNYDLTVLRARQGTAARAFTTANCEVWILPRSSVSQMNHAQFLLLRQRAQIASTSSSTGYFRLRTFTTSGQVPLADCPNYTWNPAPNRIFGPSLVLTAPGLPINTVNAGTLLHFIGAFHDDAAKTLVAAAIGWAVPGVSIFERILPANGGHNPELEASLPPADTYPFNLNMGSVTAVGRWFVRLYGTLANGIATEYIFTFTIGSTGLVADPGGETITTDTGEIIDVDL